MSSETNYKRYFDIDNDYFPTVDEGVMKTQPDLWLKYYPHETFVKMLNTMVTVLENRMTPRSIWVEGAYGTGKSHAVLTLKKLIDASDAETRAYFDNYRDLLDTSLYERLMQVKHAGRIMTVHRYGSSNIRSDEQLALRFKESIEAELVAQNLVNPAASFREEVIHKITDKHFKSAIKGWIEEKYCDDFGGETVEDIIDHLKHYEGAALETLMHKIMRLGEMEGVQTFSISIESMLDWVKAVIQKNNLKSIVFVWDEFTEYFQNNSQAITGFQRIAEFTATEALRLVIVTHKTSGLFSEKDDKRKILDRFVSPRSMIELPEHMAFKLLGAAMKKSSDAKICKEWNSIVDDLYRQTTSGRDLVKKRANVEDDDLRDMLPLHPYTAIVLKQISSAYRANQRSMFDFIKNDANEEFHGFKWFIDHVGPLSDDPLLTVDMLWDFFYEKGKQDLEKGVRNTLDYYVLKKPTDVLEQRVLKATLILQAIAKQENNSQLFIPSLANLNSALEGSTRFRNGKVESILNQLCADHILYKTKVSRTEVYNAMVSNFDDDKLAEKIKEIKDHSTDTLLPRVDSTVWNGLSAELQTRFGDVMNFVTAKNFRARIDHLNAPKAEPTNMIDVAMTWAKNDEESVILRQEIQKFYQNNPATEVVIIETCNAAFGTDALDQYAENKARAELNSSNDKKQSELFQKEADDLLTRWHQRVIDGEYMIYSRECVSGFRAERMDQMQNALKRVIRSRYANALEISFTASATLWGASQVKQGAKNGVERKTAGCYTAKKGTPNCLDTQLDAIWNDGQYWEQPQSKAQCMVVAEMKKTLVAYVEKAFEANGRVSMSDIYNLFEAEPFGIRPCNLTAFVLGFIMREFASEDFTWSDDMTSDALTVDKIGQMVADIITDKRNPSPRYRNQYIVRDKEEIRKFSDAISMVFGVERSACGSVENARGALRDKLKKLVFPIWSLKYNLTHEKVMSIKDVTDLIEKIQLFAGSNNVQGQDTTLATEIGKMYMDKGAPFYDLRDLLKSPKLTAGMKAYLANYKNGALPALAKEIGEEKENYLKCVKSKFDAGDANWLWTEDVVQQRIDEVIAEYEFVKSSRAFVRESKSFDEAIKAWKDELSLFKVPVSIFSDWYDDELLEFIQIMTELSVNGLNSRQIMTLLELFQDHSDEIQAFMSEAQRRALFERAAGIERYALPESDVNEIYSLVDANAWNASSADWNRITRQTIEDYIKNRKYEQLANHWYALTESKSPEKWSDRYETPILAMVPPAERSLAEACFETINRGMTDEARIEEAEDYLDHATFFDALKLVNSRDEAFKKAVLGDYAPVLSNLEKVKTSLKEIEPQIYKWDSSPVIRDQVKKLAEKTYKDQAYDVAFRIIDSMSDDELKGYLKDLIRNNAKVGIEIIRSRNGEA